MAGRLLEMTWRDLLFAHWPVAEATVAAAIPDDLEVATYDGDAWLGVVPFVMSDIGPRGLPTGLSFPELNLRTYVDGPRGRGVYFFNLDAGDPVGVRVARRFFALPYFRADMDVRREGETVRFTSHRRHSDAPPARFDASYRPEGEAEAPEPGSLAAFLTENYRFYTTGRRLYCGEIGHEPWPLRPASAEFRANTLFEANGFDRPDGEPLVHFAREIDVTADRVRRV